MDLYSAVDLALKSDPQFLRDKNLLDKQKELINHYNNKRTNPQYYKDEEHGVFVVYDYLLAHLQLDDVAVSLAVVFGIKDAAVSPEQN